MTLSIYALTVGPFFFGILFFPLYIIFDYIWQFFLILAIYNCIFFGIPYYTYGIGFRVRVRVRVRTNYSLRNNKFFDGIIHYWYFKLFSFIYLAFYFVQFLSFYDFLFTIMFLQIVQIVIHKSKHIKK